MGKIKSYIKRKGKGEIKSEERGRKRKEKKKELSTTINKGEHSKKRGKDSIQYVEHLG